MKGVFTDPDELKIPMCIRHKSRNEIYIQPTEMQLRGSMCVSELYSQRTRENLYRMFTKANSSNWNQSFRPDVLKQELDNDYNNNPVHIVKKYKVIHHNKLSEDVRKLGVI